jgi:hypothetical protein
VAASKVPRVEDDVACPLAVVSEVVEGEEPFLKEDILIYFKQDN